MLSRGDIFLTPFPFTDLTAKKVRPAVIVSADPQGSDVVIAFISSAPPTKPLPPSDFVLTSEHSDFPQMGLKRTSVFKMNKLPTIERSRILRHLGKISLEISKELDRCLKNALGLSMFGPP